MSEETATCRGCGRELEGKPYHMGGSAYIPKTGERARVNFYGGYVCSYNCDRQSSIRMENSMPGAGISNTLNTFAAKSLSDNWRSQP